MFEAGDFLAAMAMADDDQFKVDNEAGVVRWTVDGQPADVDFKTLDYQMNSEAKGYKGPNGFSLGHGAQKRASKEEIYAYWAGKDATQTPEAVAEKQSRIAALLTRMGVPAYAAKKLATYNRTHIDAMSDSLGAESMKMLPRSWNMIHDGRPKLYEHLLECGATWKNNRRMFEILAAFVCLPHGERWWKNLRG
jgi:hypothetical protein